MENSLGRKGMAVRGSGVRVSAVALVALLFAGCSDSTGPVDFGGVSLVAPQTIHFTTQLPGGYRQIVVPVRITNSTSKVINSATCSQTLERFDLPNWKTVWGQICLASLSNGPIQPGASGTVSVTVTDTPSQYDGWRFTDPQNDYRVRLGLYAGGDNGAAAISANLATNAFQVVP